jgi:hypothetical protein
MRSIPTKESDQFPTDKWLMNLFTDWFDPCPLNPSPTVDGLSLSWKDKTYVNPPYSNVLPWVLKSIEENKQGKRVVLLLKFDSTTKWYRALVEAGAHFIHIGERLHHGHKYPSPFSSTLVILPKK